MPMLTDEEAAALDEELTRTVPNLTDVEGPFIKNYRNSMNESSRQNASKHFSAIKLKTKGFKFDREAANE
jgi:hypothetical protein